MTLGYYAWCIKRDDGTLITHFRSPAPLIFRTRKEAVSQCSAPYRPVRVRIEEVR